MVLSIELCSTAVLFPALVKSWVYNQPVLKLGVLVCSGAICSRSMTG
jgi:hypothetical protein